MVLDKAINCKGCGILTQADVCPKCGSNPVTGEEVKAGAPAAKTAE